MRLAALLAALAFAAAGCGSDQESGVPDGLSGDEKAIAEMVADYNANLKAGNITKLCEEVLDPALVQQIEDAGARCPELFRDVPKDGTSTFVKATVKGTTAQVTLRDDKTGKTETGPAIKTGDGWRLSLPGAK